VLAAGTTFQRYKIETLLGSGGMGEVYRAYDPSLQRHIALKVLRADYAVRDGVLRADVVARAMREAQSAAAFRHPNAIAIYDVGEVDGAPFLTMELVDGRSLRSALAAGDVSLGRKLTWLIQIARALDAAHRVGLVHRDVKPDNVMVCADDTIRVLDFGIAKRVTMTPVADTSDGATAFETADGRLLGTPRYMAPEQFTGAVVDARADQYAWGIVAYECIAGLHPSSTAREPLPLAHLTQAHKPLTEVVPGLPPEVAAVVARALSTLPDARFASLGAAADALEPFATSALHLPPASAPPRRTPHGMQAAAVVGALGLFLLGGGLVLIGLRRDRPMPNLTLDAGVSAVALTPSYESASAAVSVTASASSSVAAPPSASMATVSGPAVQTDCRCYAYAQALCRVGSEKGPHTCRCAADRGMLCSTPVALEGACPSFNRAVPAGGRDGDACEGYYAVSGSDPAHLAGELQHNGKLEDCGCPDIDTFRGVQGGACTGLDNRGQTMEGVVECAYRKYKHH